MVLQSDRPRLGNTWKTSFIENGFAVENYSQVLAFHSYVKGIPFANRLVGLSFRCNPRSDFRIPLIVSVAIDFTRTDVPGPDVDLRLVRAADVNPRIGSRNGLCNFLATCIQEVATIGQNGSGVVYAFELFDPPLYVELEVAEFIL